MALMVAVFGVSGVGKSWLATGYAESHNDTLYIEASGLLRARLGKTSEELRTEAMSDFERNQMTLVEAFHAERSNSTSKVILLDAHCVIDGRNGFLDVPESTIFSIDPCQIIFVEDSPEAILARRQSDTRTRPPRSVEQIHEYQTRSLRVAEKLASASGVGVERVKAGDRMAFARIIDRVRTRLAT